MEYVWILVLAGLFTIFLILKFSTAPVEITVPTVPAAPSGTNGASASYSASAPSVAYGSNILTPDQLVTLYPNAYRKIVSSDDTALLYVKNKYTLPSNFKCVDDSGVTSPYCEKISNSVSLKCGAGTSKNPNNLQECNINYSSTNMPIPEPGKNLCHTWQDLGTTETAFDYRKDCSA